MELLTNTAAFANVVGRGLIIGSVIGLFISSAEIVGYLDELANVEQTCNVSSTLTDDMIRAYDWVLPFLVVLFFLIMAMRRTKLIHGDTESTVEDGIIQWVAFIVSVIPFVMIGIVIHLLLTVECSDALFGVHNPPTPFDPIRAFGWFLLALGVGFVFHSHGIMTSKKPDDTTKSYVLISVGSAVDTVVRLIATIMITMQVYDGKAQDWAETLVGNETTAPNSTCGYYIHNSTLEDFKHAPLENSGMKIFAIVLIVLAAIELGIRIMEFVLVLMKDDKKEHFMYTIPIRNFATMLVRLGILLFISGFVFEKEYVVCQPREQTGSFETTIVFIIVAIITTGIEIGHSLIDPKYLAWMSKFYEPESGTLVNPDGCAMGTASHLSYSFMG